MMGGGQPGQGLSALFPARVPPPLGWPARMPVQIRPWPANRRHLAPPRTA